MSTDLDAFKQGQRVVWAMGDYPDLAKTIAEVAELLVEKVGAGPGDEMLDVATGSGNVAIPAAITGAKVTGLDLTPELLAVARSRGAEAGLDVTWIEGDAEALPFADGSFDKVTSCFGVIFAPSHQAAAAELVRVARPGSTIALTAWTPEGLNGRMFKTLGAYMPPPPPDLQPAVLWGDEAHVRSLLGHSGLELSFERHMVPVVHDSPLSWVQYTQRVLGPMMMAKAMLEPQGRWEELEGDLVALYSDANEADDGSLRASAEYLITIAKLRA